MPNRRHITEASKLNMVEMHGQQISNSNIAHLLNCSPATVQRVLYKAQTTGRVVTCPTPAGGARSLSGIHASVCYITLHHVRYSSILQ
jgi:transposase